MRRTLAIWGVGVWLLGASSSSQVWGQQAFLGQSGLGYRQPSTKHRIVDKQREPSVVRFIGRVDGVSGYTLTEAERQSGGSLLGHSGSLSGDGGGGDVVPEQLLIQDRFLDSQCGFPAACGGPCNVVQFFWTENLENAQGVSIFFDGRMLGTLPGLAAGELPGTNGVAITEIPAGPHMFRAEDPVSGTFVECAIDVLDAQPFKDVADLKCEQGLVADDGTCEVSVSWNNAGPFAGSLGVIFDGGFLGTIRGNLLGVGITDSPPGEHCVDVFGVEEFSECAIYRGCFLRTCCTVTCERPSCTPPQDLLICQVAYGPNPENNAVSASWVNGEATYTAVTGLLDDAVLGTLPGNSVAAVFNPLALGPHKIGIQGDCGPPNGTSSIAEATFTVLDVTPHPMPITDDGEGIVCSFTPDPDGDGVETSSTTARWTNKDPSLFIDVYVVRDPDLLFVGTVAGTDVDVTVNNTTATDLLALQFFANVNGGCYGSPLLTCVPDTPPTNVYIQGMCNGAGTGPQISSAVYFLNFLFLGGPAPPCLKACDANGDGAGNLSDAVYVLAYLFLGGPPPTLWVDSDGNGVPDTTCTRAAVEDDCQASHEACAG